MAAVRKTRGGVLLVDEREWFARLLAQGVSNAEACRIVGIHRKTGIRWRYGRTIRNIAGEAVHYLPVRVTAPTATHARYLLLAERTVIADLHRAGVGVRGIAKELGRTPSTVSRELRRNVDGTGRYLPATAKRLSVERRSRAVPMRRVVRDKELYGVVTALLGKLWSPEQVGHELRSHFPDQPERHPCTELIYQAIYDPRIDVTLPAKGWRRSHVQGLERRGQITNMTMIADRPAEVDDRVQVGHWESDCIMGSGNHSAIGTLVQRTTRFLILVHLPTGQPAAENIRDGLAGALGGLPPHLRRTLTGIR